MARKPTQRQKNAMRLFIQHLEAAEKDNKPLPPMGEILQEAGYSQSIRTQPGKVTNSEAWKEFMDGIDDTEIVKKLKEWATDDDPDVRGHSIRAAEQVLKLKDRYPGAKGRVAHIHGELKDIFE